jgi:zinc protease
VGAWGVLLGLGRGGPVEWTALKALSSPRAGLEPFCRFPSPPLSFDCMKNTAALDSTSACSLEIPPLDAQIFVLENGLEILVHEDHSAPVASVQAWVRTGSIHEGRFLGSGISHLLEHLLFKGTEKRSCGELARQVQDAGGYINAYTSFDRTVYWMDLPSKGLPVALELLADAVFHSVLPAEEYSKEQEVIRREFAMGFDDPDRVLQKQAFATAFRVHPYRHPVIGHLEVFNALTREDVLAYYRERYVPNNVFFVVSGAVCGAEVRDRLEKELGTVPRRALAPVWIPPEPLQTGRRERAETFDTELSRLSLLWHAPELTHPDVPALDLLSSVLGQGRSARLYRSLREKRALVHSVGAWNYTPMERGLFGMDALLDPGRVEEVEAALWGELAALESGTSRALCESELNKVRRMALAGHFGGLMTASGKASDLGSSWLVSGNPDLSRHYLAMLQSVRVEDVHRVAAQYLKPDAVSVVRLEPKGSVHRVAAVRARSSRGEIQRGVLSNGLRTLVCQDGRLPLVTLVAAFRGGLLAETPRTNGGSRLLARALVRGTGSRTAEQIAEEVESLGGALSADAGNNSISLSVRVLRDDIERGMEILADVLARSTLPEEIVERERMAQLAALKEEEEEPMPIARRLLRGALFAGHPYGMRALGSPESVAGLTRERLAGLRDECLVGRNGVLSVFGDVDPAQVSGWMERHFSVLPPGKSLFEQPPQPVRLDASREINEVRDKHQSVILVGYRGTDIFSPDRAALSLVDEACSDLGSRMFVRIREQLGLAYFVGSSQFSGLAPGSFHFYLGTDPLKRTAVLAELRDEIRQLAERGLEEAELERAKQKFLGAMDIRAQSVDAFAGECTLDELYGLGADHFRTVRENIRRVTVVDTRRVAGEYLGVEQPSVMVQVGPEQFS